MRARANAGGPNFPTNSIADKSAAATSTALPTSAPKIATASSARTSIPGAEELSRYWSGGKCAGTGATTFSFAPFALEEMAFILPMGLMVAGHVTPIDHQYYSAKSGIGWRGEGGGGTPLLALADGFIVQITHRTEAVGTGQAIQNYDRWRPVIEHSCTFYSYYDEVIGLTDDILKQLTLSGKSQLLQTRIPVKAGQVIGTARVVDLGVVNTEKSLKGFVTPALYNRESWKIFTVDPFDYYAPAVREKLLAMNLRQASPPGGKIDFDVDGRLAGNWFQQGTNGYAGKSNSPR